jgi:TM2 domain-containing membrane protein YozV
MPEIQGEEFFYLEKLCELMTDEQIKSFASIYRARRRDPQNVMLLTLVGLFFAAGLQRFYVNQIGWGVVYLLTFGFCLIGTIVDLVNYKELAFEYNQKVADELVRMV